MVLQKKKSFDFRDTYNRYKKNTVFLGVSLYGLNNAYGQVCVPVPTYIDSTPSNPTCQVQMYPGATAGDLNPSYPARSIIRINLGILSSGGDQNKYKFSTVGESTEDTELYLYDSAGGLLEHNDDDASGTKQSTIIYHFPTPAGSTGFLMGAYLVVAKKGCQPLADPIRIKFNVTNLSDISPEIIEPSPFCLCKGNSAMLGASVSSSAAGVNTWTSSDTAIATINAATGEITFKDAGTVDISLTNSANSGCKTTNRYVIKKPTKTLSIILD